MNDFITSSLFFGLILSLGSYMLAIYIQKKINISVFNPLVFASILVIIILLVFKIPYDTYNSSADYLSYLLTPTTICLAVPLYKQIVILRKNLPAVLIGVLSGILTNIFCILIVALIFHLSKTDTVSFLPKSITTAIALSVSEENGGIPSLTSALITVAGITGNLSAPFICKWFRIQSAVSRGLAIGTSSHAMGTTRALEMGEVEGAMSSLAIAVAGLLTAFIIPVVVAFLH